MPKPESAAKLCDWTGVFPRCSYVVLVNLKLTSACVIGGVVAFAMPLAALTSLAATPNPSSTSDGAADNSNPYAVIVDRNVFRLNPPPPPPSAEKKPVELPKVYLNGIIKVGDDVRVLFSIPPKDPKGQTTYFKLAPGERDDVLELVKIHPDQEEVDVLVSGTPMTLSVLSNSLASSGSKGGGGSPPPEPVAEAPRGSSAIIAGGGGNSSPYGGVTVGGGGGGVTTIGGGDSTSGGGVAVAGGSGSGSGFGGGGGGGSPTSFGGGGEGGVAVAGGTGAQIATTLFSGGGSPGQAQSANTSTGSVVPPEQQPLIIAAQAATGDMPPLPPNIQQMVNGGTGDEETSPPLPSLPGLPK